MQLKLAPTQHSFVDSFSFVSAISRVMVAVQLQRLSAGETSKQALLDKLDTCIHNTDSTGAMAAVAELSAAVRGVAQLLAHLVELYAYTMLARNDFITQQLADAFSAISTLPRVRIAASVTYHELISRGVALLMVCEPTDRRFRGAQAQYEMDDLMPHLQKHAAVAAALPPLAACISSAVSSETAVLVTMLLAAIKDGDAAAVQQLAEHMLLSTHNPPCAAIIHHDLEHIRPLLRADVVWALWLACVHHAAQNDVTREWARSHMRLYALSFRRLHRNNRLPLLLWVLHCLTKRKHVKHVPVDLPATVFPALNTARPKRSDEAVAPRLEYLKMGLSNE
jgi:hypothetical protein